MKKFKFIRNITNKKQNLNNFHSFTEITIQNYYFFGNKILICHGKIKKQNKNFFSKFFGQFVNFTSI